MLFGLIGRKLSHSFSAKFFNKKFKEEGIDAEYKLFPMATIAELKNLFHQYPDLMGLNVTVPYKEEVIPYLNNMSDVVKEIKAANVIKIDRNNGNFFLNGFNTDVIGFRDSLVPLLNEKIKNALILGTGGASKAVAFVLKNLNINITFVSRTPKINAITYEELSEQIMKHNLLIVNTTPLGMFPDIDAFPPIPYQFITENHICYDLIYNPEETKFLTIAKQKGALIKNGMEMLYLQAIASWDIWTK